MDNEKRPDKNGLIDDYLSSHAFDGKAPSIYEEIGETKPKNIVYDKEELYQYQNQGEISEYKRKKLPTVIKTAVFAAVIILAAIFAYLHFSSAGAKCDKYYDSLYKSTSGTDYAALVKENPDFAGYLSFCDKHYPVVLPKNNDITYYGSHLFSGVKNKYGTPYTTAKEGEETPFVTAVYGNDFSDGRMFAPLYKYTDSAYSKEYPTVSYSDKNTEREWAVFSAFSFSGDEPFLLDRISFLNDGLKSEYIDNLKNESKNAFETDVNKDDKILLLITKGESSTVCVAARLLRQGETKDKITKSKTQNTAATVSGVTSKSAAVSSEAGSVSKKSGSSSYTVSYNVEKPKNRNTEKYEQTGLTDNMDKTVKINVNPVVTMTSVVGMDSVAAKSILKSTLGIGVKLEYEESNEKKGRVLSQSVSEGAQVTTDVTVVLTVSTGVRAGMAIVPDIVGNSKTNAETILKNANLKLGTISEQSSALEKGTVVDQSTDPGKEVKKGTKINIYVSDGKLKLKTVSMPDIVGTSKSSAINALKKAGLKAGSVSVVASSKSAGTVLSQEVPKNSKVEVGSKINFTVSNGSKVNNLTVTNESWWSVTVNGKSYAPGAVIKGSYNDIIPCIVEAEIGSGVGIEAMKSQAVATYCWLYNAGSTKGSAPGVPMKTASSKAKEAARAVEGKKVYYGGSVAQTYYYAISGGYSANCKDIWYADLPYLRAVNSSVDKSAYGYETKVTYSSSKVRSLIKSYYGVDLKGVDKSKWLKAAYDENNTYLRTINLGGKKTVRGCTLRDAFNYELRSTAVKIEYNKSSDSFTFTVHGYGHGVGMSQVGAAAYAKKGWTYENILTHYYPGTTVS